MEDLIEKINTKGRKIQQEEMDKEAMRRMEIEKDYIAAKGLSSRINKLWDICQALLDNGFKLGKSKHWVGTDYYEFQTDGIYHWLGFVVRNKQILAFGITGGGCDGRSVYIDREGKIGMFVNGGFREDNIDDSCYISNGDNYAPSRGRTYQDPYFTGKLRKIVLEFDDFERRVMEYANSIANS